MAAAQVQSNNGDEDYIDMEVSSSSSSSSSSSPSFISFSVSSPPHNREFEFQMCSSAANSDNQTTSPADELFYKGQLLPLHLPPRLQMVQKLLESSNVVSGRQERDSNSISDAPLESRPVSPSESRRVSSEIKPDEYLYEISTELRNLIRSDCSRNSWSRKIKQMKPSLIGQRIRASRDYFKSLFMKSACSEAESCCNKTNESPNQNGKTLKMKIPFGKIETFDENVNNLNHRKSFSGVIRRHCPTKCLSSGSSSSESSSSSSSSFSFSSNGSLNLQFLKRSSSATSSEIENSIQGAIAHCKKSFSPVKISNSNDEAGLCSSKIAVSREKGWLEICRI